MDIQWNIEIYGFILHRIHGDECMSSNFMHLTHLWTVPQRTQLVHNQLYVLNFQSQDNLLIILILRFSQVTADVIIELKHRFLTTNNATQNWPLFGFERSSHHSRDIQCVFVVWQGINRESVELLLQTTNKSRTSGSSLEILLSN